MHSGLSTKEVIYLQRLIQFTYDCDCEKMYKGTKKRRARERQSNVGTERERGRERERVHAGTHTKKVYKTIREKFLIPPLIKSEKKKTK